VPWKSLSNEPFVMYSHIQKRQSYDSIIALCQKNGFSPHIAQEAGTEAAVIGLVAAGLGVAITTASLSSVRSDEVVYRPLTDPIHDINFAVMWDPNNLSPTGKMFCELALENVSWREMRQENTVI
jgi:DNA-binding transcriptional LysR family regulator